MAHTHAWSHLKLRCGAVVHNGGESVSTAAGCCIKETDTLKSFTSNDFGRR